MNFLIILFYEEFYMHMAISSSFSPHFCALASFLLCVPHSWSRLQCRSWRRIRSAVARSAFGLVAVVGC